MGRGKGPGLGTRRWALVGTHGNRKTTTGYKEQGVMHMSYERGRRYRRAGMLALVLALLLGQSLQATAHYLEECRPPSACPRRMPAASALAGP